MILKPIFVPLLLLFATLYDVPSVAVAAVADERQAAGLRGTVQNRDGESHEAIDYAAVENEGNGRAEDADRKLQTECPCFYSSSLNTLDTCHSNSDGHLAMREDGNSNSRAEVNEADSSCTFHFYETNPDIHRHHEDLTWRQVRACHRLIEERCKTQFSYSLDPGSALEDRDGTYYTDPTGSALTNSWVGTLSPGEIVAWSKEALVQDGEACPGFAEGNLSIQFDSPVQVTKVVFHIMESICMGLDSPDRIAINLPFSGGTFVVLPKTASADNGDEGTSRYRKVTIDIPSDSPPVSGFDVTVASLRTVQGDTETPSRCNNAAYSSSWVKFGISEIVVFDF